MKDFSSLLRQARSFVAPLRQHLLNEDRDRESYFAQAVDLADLEHRMHEWNRHHSSSGRAPMHLR